MLASLFFVFSLGGAVWHERGNDSSVIMLVPVMRRLGYDNVTTLLVTFIATQIGFATSWMNLFSVAVAQVSPSYPVERVCPAPGDVGGVHRLRYRVHPALCHANPAARTCPAKRRSL